MSYLLQVGDAGKERLGILNEIFSESSYQLLHWAGITQGSTVLEIGCGTGNMTCWIAQQVGSEGYMYAADISDEQIAIAKQQAKERRLQNITFIHHSVFDLTDLPKVDFVYARFVIMHLSEPLRALEGLRQFLKPGGRLICEEASNSAAYCYPASLAFQKTRQLLLALFQKKGIDFDLGEKIYSYFHDLKFKNIFTRFVQPIYQNKAQKRIILLLMLEIKQHYIDNGLATEEEINELIKELTTFIEDDRYLVSFPRTTQIYGSLEPT
jgi:ubiquinone/menaquinone biosynthesis C-methylase UbiE